MQRARIINEIYKISTETMVKFNIKDGWIIVEDLQTPEGWNPERIDLRLEPPDDYPAHPPVVYVPDELCYEGKRPLIMMPPATAADPDWCQLDVGLGTQVEWEPTCHTLGTVVKLVLQTLWVNSQHRTGGEEPLLGTDTNADESSTEDSEDQTDDNFSPE